jgi:protein O-GlcNAc transferase
MFGRKGTPSDEKDPSRPTVANSTDDSRITLQHQADQLLAAKRYSDARTLYERLLEGDPDNLYLLYQLAGSLEGMGDLDAAARICDRGLALSPDQPALLHRRGGIAYKRSQFVLALETFERLKLLHPEFPLVDAMIADQLASLGRGAEAIIAFDRALTLAPDIPRLQSDRLFVLNYFGLLSRKELFDEHRRWGAGHEAQLRTFWRGHEQSRDPERKLRVGYVSPDLRRHAVAFFIEGVLRHHDRSRFEIHGIDVSPYAEDEVTKRLAGYCDGFHRLVESTDDEIAEFIRAREIDVLVDLAGHTAHNRLLVFARRPAPVQVGWFGYMNTTGLTSIGYRLTDASLDPPGMSEEFYTEQLFRLSAAACFQPDPDSPEVAALPADLAGRVTMGSLNQWTKVTEATKDVWAGILRDVPAARLIVVARGGGDPGVRSRIENDFRRRGVPDHQLEVVDFLPLKRFLAMLNTVDFALDPFPYGGGTTTLHAAWMGVPSVTLETDSELGRSTAGILRGLGIGELVAHDGEEYRGIATRLVQDLPRLRVYRRELRPRFSRSSLVDSLPLTREVEGAFRTMWREYCGSGASKGATAATGDTIA